MLYIIDFQLINIREKEVLGFEGKKKTMFDIRFSMFRKQTSKNEYQTSKT